MLEKTISVNFEGKEYEVTKVFVSDSKAQEVFWKRYFSMGVRLLQSSQKKEGAKAVKHEKCHSISKA